MSEKLPSEVQAYHQKMVEKLESRLSDVQKQLKNLLDERNQLREAVFVHHKVLGTEPEGIRHPEISNPESAKKYMEQRRAREQARKEQQQSRSADTDISELGLRDAIRLVLTNAGRGLRPIEVSHELENRGYQSDGKVALSARVGNELWRMANQNHLRKRKSKYFPLNAE